VVRWTGGKEDWEKWETGEIGEFDDPKFIKVK